ncbi:hypothetical protein [Dyadobacter bucti]|uniref:hypothetical protein n=1 Tax=Dyadobacter bucti TaxID=2572203 RepID=UPI001107FB8B
MKQQVKSMDKSDTACVESTKPVNPIVRKMLDDKAAIGKFFQGKISSDEIDARGIKFVKAV